MHGTCQQWPFSEVTTENGIYNTIRILHSVVPELELLWVFQEQLFRWRQAGLSTREHEQIKRLSVQLERLHTVLTDILVLADELRHCTIDKVLTKSDLELGIAALLSGIKRH